MQVFVDADSHPCYYDMQMTLKTKVCHCCGGNGKEFDHRVVGAEMAKKRHATGKSQSEMGRLMGVSGPYICDLELGKRCWRQELVDRFLEALNS